MTSRVNPWAVLVVLSLGLFMTLLDLTIVNIAIPSLVDGIHASLDQVLWVLNAYSLAYAVLLISSGRLGDLLGPRNLFVAGLVVFTAASACSGLAHDPVQLIAGRAAQGVGAAMLAPQTLPILLSLFPPERRGATFAVFGILAGVAVVAGPTVGGFLVTNVGWRWIFYVNLPVGVAVIVAAMVLVPDLRPGLRHRHPDDPRNPRRRRDGAPGVPASPGPAPGARAAARVRGVPGSQLRGHDARAPGDGLRHPGPVPAADDLLPVGPGLERDRCRPDGGDPAGVHARQLRHRQWAGGPARRQQAPARRRPAAAGRRLRLHRLEGAGGLQPLGLRARPGRRRAGRGLHLGPGVQPRHARPAARAGRRRLWRPQHDPGAGRRDRQRRRWGAAPEPPGHGPARPLRGVRGAAAGAVPGTLRGRVRRRGQGRLRDRRRPDRRQRPAPAWAAGPGGAAGAAAGPRDLRPRIRRFDASDDGAPDRRARGGGPDHCGRRPGPRPRGSRAGQRRRGGQGLLSGANGGAGPRPRARPCPPGPARLAPP